MSHVSGQGKPVCESLRGEEVAATEESGSTKDQDPEATPICGPIQGQEPSEEQGH